MANQKTASLLIIGNEILSGRTQDKNLNYIAQKLVGIGIKLSEVRVVADIHNEIAESLNALRSKHDYVFTTGGIGPTHDDITTDSVAQAFGVKVICHPEARKLLEDYYKGRGIEINEARLRMANTPEGAELIDNPLTAAPGYKKDNVFVLAGVPKIMQVMFDFAMQYLEGGDIMHSKTISCNLVEGDIAAELSSTQNEFPQAEIGSYPSLNNGTFSVSIVIRSYDNDKVTEVANKIKDIISSKGGKEI